MSRLTHIAHVYRELFDTSAWHRRSLVASALAILVMILLPAMRLIPSLEEQSYIPLHYNIYFGIDRFGPWEAVFALPLAGIVLVLVNTLCELVWFHREPVLSPILALAEMGAQAALLTATVFVVLLNI
ncbi:hypothetical protein HY734_02785 [Candidatus Uhrbacteria bacterium]|nr:hypothetical protein [Candidatus Uhrbacteria bacterium]